MSMEALFETMVKQKPLTVKDAEYLSKEEVLDCINSCYECVMGAYYEAENKEEKDVAESWLMALECVRYYIRSGNKVKKGT